MRRFLIVVAAVVAVWIAGCNNITGIGNLTFTNTGPGGGSSGGSGDDSGLPSNSNAGSSSGTGSGSSSGSASSSGSVSPAGTHVVSSSSLVLRGMTTDGYAAYGDRTSGTLSVVAVEEADGGAPSTSAPFSLGTADIATSNVERKTVLFFSGTEADAGPSRIGTLNAWTSSMTAPKVISTGVLEPVFGSFFTVATSADGQYLTYLGNVALDGTTASLFLMDLQSGMTRTLLTSIDILRDACQPRINFSGPYVVASYCQLPTGGTVPDAGANRDVATLASFVAATGVSTTLATSVNPRFGVDPNGGTAIMLNQTGIVASAVSGAGGLVSIDPTGASGIIAADGKTIVYSTTAKALKRANTSAPVTVVSLVPNSFAVVSVLSRDTNWAIGYLFSGTQSGTSDLYAASTTAAGSAIPLSTATNATVGSAGDAFTADSKYALYLTGVSASFVGTLNAHPLAAGGSAVSVGSGAYEVAAAIDSQIVFNLNDSAGKADLEWTDLAAAGPPTPLVSKADDFFLLGPAKDKIVYTISGTASSDGLWIMPVPGAQGTQTCADAGAIAFHPSTGAPGSCTATEVSTYDTACVGAQRSMSACSAVLGMISTTCYNCLDTPDTASQWGPIVEDLAGGGIVQLNPGGCYAQEGEVGCGTAQQAELECEDNACASQTTLATFQTCVTNADNAICACYVANATAACAAFSSSVCNPASYSSFETEFLALAAAMCE
jgi:hypothetical protein